MNYFVFDYERKNTVYHEFQKGKFDGYTFWKDDSISLSDDLLNQLVRELFADTIPEYDPCSEFEIDKELWERILHKAQQVGGETLACILEADEWAENTFREYDVFTIIGV